MKTTAIRQRLHQFIETAEEKKLKAIYTLFEAEITQDEWEYSDEFKAELDQRVDYYKKGGKMVSEAELNKQIKELLKRSKKNELSFYLRTQSFSRIQGKEIPAKNMKSNALVHCE